MNATTDARLASPAQDPDTWAAEYVLGTLPAAARQQVEARLPRDPALRLAVRHWEARLLPLTSLATEVEPSAALWPRISTSLQAEAASATTTQLADAPARAVTAPRESRGFWASLGLWRLMAGGGFALAALLASVVLRQAGVDPMPRHVVVLVAPQDKAPGWVVQNAGTDRLRLIPLGPVTVPADKSLQFWTKADQWSGPVSLGLVQPGQALEVPIDRLPPLEPNQLFELTMEPAAGSPLDRPTGPILFIGRSVKVLWPSRGAAAKVGRARPDPRPRCGPC